MGCDTKLFVTCGKDKLFEVIQDVVGELNIYNRKKLDNYWSNETEYKSRIQFLWSETEIAENWTNGVSLSANDFNCISIHMAVGESRTIKVLPDCSCDYADVYDGEKIIFNLGCWGLSEEIMLVVAKAVAKYGDVYYDYNDCDDIGFKKLELED